jgi:acyl carrier protein
MAAVISHDAQSDVDAILTALKQILVDDLNVAVPPEGIAVNAPLRDLNMDSVALIELISAVEARFGFMFVDSDLVSSTFASLRALSEVIAKRIGATG